MTVRPEDHADDDLARQRRKRDERLLAQPLPGDPTLTVGDVVADALGAMEAESGPDAEFDVREYLADQGHDRPTIETVADHLERQELRRAIAMSDRPSP
jgi:hypothetical protein